MSGFQKSVEPWIGKLAHALFAIPPLIMGVLLLVYGLATIWSHWIIVKRAGYPGCWSLMLLVPCVNIIFLLGFAFTRWPAQGRKK